MNGEGIYDTRRHEPFGEGDALRFTQSKDGDVVYVFALEWPGTELTVSSVSAKSGSEIRLLGFDEPLEWSASEGGGLRIRLPGAGDPPDDLPRPAWAFRVEVGSR